MTMLLEPWHRSRGAHLTAGRVEHYGDPVAEYRAVTSTVAVVDGSWRDRLVVTGDDRLAFVQGLCTNDVEALAEGHACELVFITPKGRMVADARCTKLDDALLLELEPGRGAALVEQLAKYRIHEAVEWQDAAEWLAALELWGPLAAQALGLERLEPGAGSAVVVDDVALIAVGTPFGAVCYVPADGVAAAA